MKNYTLPQSILLLFLSLFLFNCGNATSTTSTPNIDATTKTLIDKVQNPELKKKIQTLAETTKTKKLDEFDFLLLVLDESSEQKTQIEILKYFIPINGTNIPPAIISALLFKAIELKKEDIVSALLDRVKINIKARDNEDRTLLHAAVAYSSLNIVTSLLHAGVQINAKSSSHGTPLHYVLAAPYELGKTKTNTPEIREGILRKLLENRKINLRVKNPTNKLANELAKDLVTQNADNPSKKAFYESAVKLIEAREKEK